MLLLSDKYDFMFTMENTILNSFILRADFLSTSTR